MTKGDKKVVKFHVEKTTPGAVRFKEVDDKGERVTIADGASIGTLYIRKSALGTNVPEDITVTVEAS